jgi:plasmid maintenance system antidote protein VapI
MKTLKQIFLEHGWTPMRAAETGISYNTIAKHIQGKRNIGVRAALKYEKLLGIPRWELRPDLWDPPEAVNAGQG